MFDSIGKTLSRIRYDVKELYTYADVEEFCQQVFYTLNGVLNPIVPASILVFFGIDEDIMNGNKSGYTYGMTLGNVVAISPYSIIHSVYHQTESDMQNKRWTAKGLTLYVVIHELLHLGQDFGAYYNMYEDRVQAKEAIEWSCHKMTEQVTARLYDTHMMYTMFGGDMENNEVNCSSFIDPTKNVANYIPATDIYHELFYHINSLLFNEVVGNKILEILRERHKENVEVCIHTADKTIMRGGLLIYNGLPVQPRMVFYLLYPMIVRSLAASRMSFQVSIGESKFMHMNLLVDIELPNEFKYLPIIERIPPMAAPAPCLY